MDIDSLFVSRLLKSKSDEEYKTAIREIKSDLVHGEERRIYLFIKKYYSDSHGKLPSLNAVNAKFPEFELSVPKDSMHFYIEELRNRSDYETLTTDISTMQNYLFEKNIEKTKEILQGLNVKLSGNDAVKVSQTGRDLPERIKLFDQAKANKGIIGLQTGIKSLDKHIGGLQDEMLVVVAKTGMGKTFSVTLMLAEMWKQVEGSILFVSNEMSAIAIQRRIDSAVGKFSTSRYKKGLLYPDEEKRLRSLENIYKKRHVVNVVQGSGRSVDSIEMDILAFEPVLLFVDGLYLTDEGKNDPFKDALAASTKYQRIIKKYKLPGIMTTMLNKDNDAKYAGRIGEDADIVMKLSQSLAMYDDKTMGISFNKIREEDSHLRIWRWWDFDKWNFGEKDYEHCEESMEKEYEG